MADPVIGGVPFEEAIAFLRQKARIPTRTWTDIWEGMHARAFVVAGAMQDALIADFHEAVTRALAEGTTLRDFRESFDEIVARHGWSHNGGPGWRSAVIYNTNLRMARAAGRWDQIERQAQARPFLRYSAVMDSKTRPEHAAWHGLVLPVDDPFWKTHYPPNGWNCRCTVTQWSARDLDRHGWSVGASPNPGEETRAVNTPDGVKQVPGFRGIDTGFGYNVGIAGFGSGAMRAAMEGHGEIMTALFAPGGSRPAQPPDLNAADIPVPLGPRAARGDEEALRAAWRVAMGGAEEKVFSDPAGQRVALGPAIVDHMLESRARQDGRDRFFPLLPDLITDPQEIWIGFARGASGRVYMRRRYIKAYRTPEVRAFHAAADFDNGQWSAMTVLRGQPDKTGATRTGLRIYENGE
jgi:SPP1 gp7 family putative phage head morphogenesis protein